ncbi:copper resistance CopC family protein [Nonomuraea sp. NPDC050404]|uniref:copper resistance CopC family protein n=1 Tax=Nonomuraea sp. NPDC050404 TaxID=3155783 RepID=UPI00340726C1
MTTFRRSIIRSLALAAIALLAVASMGAPAFAHAGLKSSDPKDGSTVKEAISSVELVFTEDIQPKYTTVVITGPGGAKVADGKPKVDGDTVTLALKPDLADGRYAIAFRVISADGHPVTDELHFTLKLPEPEPTPTTTEESADAGASPAPTTAAPAPSSAEPVPAAASSADEGSAGIPVVLLVIGGLVLVAGVVVVVTGRRRAAGSKP